MERLPEILFGIVLLVLVVVLFLMRSDDSNSHRVSIHKCVVENYALSDPLAVCTSKYYLEFN